MFLENTIAFEVESFLFFMPYILSYSQNVKFASELYGKKNNEDKKKHLEQAVTKLYRSTATFFAGCVTTLMPLFGKSKIAHIELLYDLFFFGKIELLTNFSPIIAVLVKLFLTKKPIPP